ncbi:hypothetical protein VNO77_27472 [Canavalia gladiata]|uniref:Uncharacterized protein n=1 Tax=Canavalia gladiata TaxID=3824 RepID=A0AAN9KXC3_CANGL
MEIHKVKAFFRCKLHCRHSCYDLHKGRSGLCLIYGSVNQALARRNIENMGGTRRGSRRRYSVISEPSLAINVHLKLGLGFDNGASVMK